MEWNGMLLGCVSCTPVCEGLIVLGLQLPFVVWHKNKRIASAQLLGIHIQMPVVCSGRDGR